MKRRFQHVCMFRLPFLLVLCFCFTSVSCSVSISLSFCFRNKRSEHRSSVSESSSSRSYVSNKGSIKSSESHVSHTGSVATAAANKNFYHREIVAQDSEDNITRLSESVDGFVTPILVSKDAIPPRYTQQRWFFLSEQQASTSNLFEATITSNTV